MHAKFYRRWPVGSIRHSKRRLSGTFSVDGSDDVTADTFPLTAPLTITVTLPVTKTTSSTISSTQSTPVITSTAGRTTSTSTSLSTSLATPASSTQTSLSVSVTPPPSPSATLTGNNGNSPIAEQSNGNLGTRSLPTGAIVGIIIASLLVLIAAVIFGMRKRSMQNRMKLRGMWTKSKSVAVGPPVGSWEAKGSAAPTPLTGPAVISPQMVETKSGESSPGIQFAQAQTYATNSRVPGLSPPATAYGNEDFTTSNLMIIQPGGEISSATSSYATPTLLSPFTATVQCTFIPQLPDELSITTGEIIRVLAEYDDGWAFCMNARGGQGMVPVECLDRVGLMSPPQLEVRDVRSFKRESSLRAATPPRK